MYNVVKNNYTIEGDILHYLEVINQIIILFLIISIGVIVGKTKIITEELNVGLSKILMNVTLPFLIVSAFNFDFSIEMLKTSGIILIISLLVHGTLFLISLIMYRKQEDSVRTVLRFITIFSNCGFIGYPVAGSIYGNEGIFFTSMYNVGFNVFVWTLGVMMFQKKGSNNFYKKIFLNPGIISVIIGLIMFVFSIKLPFPISKTIELVGGMTIPLSMIVVGVSICSADLKLAFKKIVYYYASFVRLIVIPLVLYGVLYLFNAKGIVLGIPIIVSAMPAAANTVPFAQIYDGNVNCASEITVVSTIFSAITLPLILLLL